MLKITKLDRPTKTVHFKSFVEAAQISHVAPIRWLNDKWQLLQNISPYYVELNKALEQYTQFDPAIINTESTKQARYILDPVKNKDLIDQWAEKYTQEQFGIVMWSMIEKYRTRLNKKDALIQELTKMQDYMTRWLEVEKQR